MNDIWRVTADPGGEQTIWHGDTAVLRRSDLAPHVPYAYRDALWGRIAIDIAHGDLGERIQSRLPSAHPHGFEGMPVERGRCAICGLPDDPPQDADWLDDVDRRLGSSVRNARHAAGAMDLIHDAVVAEPDGDVADAAEVSEW